MGGGNLLETLVNCYCLCHQHRTGLFDCENDPKLFNLRIDRREAFREVLEKPRGIRIAASADVKAPHDGLAATGREEALVSVAALLWAVSDRVEPLITALSPRGSLSATSGPAFGSREFWLAPKPAGPIVGRAPALPRLEEDVADMLSLYHPKLSITPRRLDQVELLPVQLPIATRRLLEARAADLRIAMASMGANVRFHLELAPGFPPAAAARFLVARLEPLDEDRLSDLLGECVRLGAAILVLPELRVPPEALATIRQFLRSQTRSGLAQGRGLALVVAGSWHEQEGGGWFNRARVLDHNGEELWRHEKLAEFHITPQNVRENPPFYAELGIGEHGARERIDRGTSLRFCDSPTGRLAVAICAGFFHQPLEQALIESAASVFLVPAMTPDTRPLQERAQSLARSQHAATFVANCGTVGGTEAACFFRLPWQNCEPRKAKTNEEPLVFSLNDSLVWYNKNRSK